MMESFEYNWNVLNKTPTECFHLACEIYPEIGFTIWKKRDIGWLVLAKKNDQDLEIDSNFSARPTNPTSATLTVSSPKVPVEELERIAKRFVEEFIQREVI